MSWQKLHSCPGLCQQLFSVNNTVKYQCRGLRRLKVCTQHSITPCQGKVQKYKEEEKSKKAGHGGFKYSYSSLSPHPYRCYPFQPYSEIHNDLIHSEAKEREREARLISPSLSIVRGLLVLWFPGHICRGGVGFQWRPVLCHTGAPQIQFHALYAEHLPSA